MTSICSIMSKVQKVFIDCVAVMNDGAILGDTGVQNISLIAKEFNVPVFVLAPRYKFSPVFIFSLDAINERKK